MFGESWEVNAKFVAPLGEIPKEFQPAASKEPEQDATDKPATSELSEKNTAEPAEDELNVKDLALTKDASDIEYRSLLRTFSSRAKPT